MSLSSALSIAQSSIRNVGRQTSVVSRNVLEAGNTDYSRRTAVVSSTAPGARILEIQRATSDQLFRQNLGALSQWSGQSALYSGMDRLGVAVNGVGNAGSAASAIGKLQEAMQLYSASPSNHNLAENALDAARQVVRSLNDGTTAIQTFRSRSRSGDRHLRRRIEQSARRLQERQRPHHRRHACRSRRVRPARPARRDAQADRRIRTRDDLFARRQRHGGDDQRRHHAVRSPCRGR